MMKCISTSSFALLIDGRKGDYFERMDIHQGDPLSPSLHIGRDVISAFEMRASHYNYTPTKNGGLRFTNICCFFFCANDMMICSVGGARFP